MDDDLSTTPLAQIDWDFIAVWRFLTILILLVLVLQMVMMLSHYWHWLMPLRREVEKGGSGIRLIAPPVVWTFAYHVAVTIFLVFVAVGMAQNVYHERGANLFTYAGPALAGTLAVIVNRFLRYYSRTLGEVHRQSQRHP